MNGQLHSAARLLLKKEPLVSIEEDVWWIREPVWTLSRRDKSFATPPPPPAFETRFLRCPARSWIIIKTEQFRLLNIWYTVMKWQNTAYTYWIRNDEDCAGFDWISTPGVSLPHLVLVLCRQICIFRAALFFVVLCVQLSLLCKHYRTKLFNPLNAELNPICYLLALLGDHHFLHVSRIRVKSLTFRLLMSYIYGAPILDVSRSHTTTQHSR